LLQPLDRVVIGSEVLLYRHSCNPLDTPERRESKQASAEYAVAEYQKALLTGNSSRRKTVEVAALEEQLKSLQVSFEVCHTEHTLTCASQIVQLCDDITAHGNVHYLRLSSLFARIKHRTT
jgi:hypothetical protein